MKKQLLPILTAGTLLLSGCGEDSSTAGIAVSDITGTWVHTDSDGTDTLTLRSDMTYDKHVELGGDFPMSADSSDTWSLSRNVISIFFF